MFRKLKFRYFVAVKILRKFNLIFLAFSETLKRKLLSFNELKQ